MEKFGQLSGKAAALMRTNIDTDIITPMGRLVSRAKSAMHEIAFEPLRYLADGSENPDFILNQDGFRGAPILIAGDNFGCGSSRESAVWALAGLGIRCVIAESFGDIFFNNCFQNGVLPVRLSAADIAVLAEQAQDPSANAIFVVDLEQRQITTPSGKSFDFEVQADRRHALLEGLDDISQTKTSEAEIAAFQAEDQKRRPWLYELEA